MNSTCYRYTYLYISSIIFILFLACDHGLQPEAQEPSQISGISGTISYVNWPASDFLFDLRLIVFERYPPGDIFTELIEGRAQVYPAIGQDGLPFNIDTTRYVMELNAGDYEYVVVAQQFGPNVFEDWLAAGQYDTLLTDDLPTPVTVQVGEILENINIHVDFDSLPPQPF